MARLAVGASRQQRLSVNGRRQERRASDSLRNRLVQLRQRCQNCEMLRLLDSRRTLAPLLASAVLACGSAAPIDIGTEISPAEPDDTAVDVDDDGVAGQRIDVRLQRVAEQGFRFVLARAVDADLGLQDGDEPGRCDPHAVLELLIGDRGNPVLFCILDH